MQNPYQASSPSEAIEAAGVPVWYTVFCRIYVPAWWVGTALIAGSWIRVVSPAIGWVGFWVTAAASLGAYLLPSLAGVKRFREPDLVVVSSLSLEERNSTYLHAMTGFRAGARLLYDGVMFYLEPNNSVECAIPTNTSRLSEGDAKRSADEAMRVFASLMNASSDFAEIVRGRVMRVSILSSFGPGSVQHGRVIDGQLEMFPPTAETAT